MLLASTLQRDGRMKNPIKVSVILAFVLGLFFSAGCHTMEGAGKDVQKGGEKLEDAAKRANN